MPWPGGNVALRPRLSRELRLGVLRAEGVELRGLPEAWKAGKLTVEADLSDPLRLNCDRCLSFS